MNQVDGSDYGTTWCIQQPAQLIRGQISRILWEGGLSFRKLNRKHAYLYLQ
jgi:hypothetical protein